MRCRAGSVSTDPTQDVCPINRYADNTVPTRQMSYIAQIRNRSAVKDLDQEVGIDYRLSPRVADSVVTRRQVHSVFPAVSFTSLASSTWKPYVEYKRKDNSPPAVTSTRTKSTSHHRTMQLTLHATRPQHLTALASRLVQAMSCPVGENPTCSAQGVVGMRGSMAIRLRPCMT